MRLSALFFPCTLDKYKPTGYFNQKVNFFQRLIQKIPGRKETAMADATTRENKKDQSVRKILNAALLVFATQGYKWCPG